MTKNNFQCLMCGATRYIPVFNYTTPPEGETHFAFTDNKNYHREVLKCESCGHFISRHQMDDSNIYTGEYVNATYGNRKGLLQTFNRIISLKPEQSDNHGRVQCLYEFGKIFFSTEFLSQNTPHILDVGSGLCVFLYQMKMTSGWKCTALDPDPQAIAHAKETVGISTIQGDFLKTTDLEKYDIITLNKVIEHVPNPLDMLIKARESLNPNGFIYIEVPDGEVAVKYGPGREEFFIDHFHIFSLSSLNNLILQAGLIPLQIERLQEPSTKYTLRAFSTAKDH